MSYPPRMSRAASRRIEAANATSKGQPRPWQRDNRLPETRGTRPVGSRGCWCGNDAHGWPGDKDGAPHPRTWPGKGNGQPYPVPEGYELPRNARP